MRAWLLAAMALAAVVPRAASAASPTPLDPARVHHIKEQILAKLGLSSRPRAVGAPPRDVVRQILARAADGGNQPDHTHEYHEPNREVIAIAHRAIRYVKKPALEGAIFESVTCTRPASGPNCADGFADVKNMRKCKSPPLRRRNQHLEEAERPRRRRRSRSHENLIKHRLFIITKYGPVCFLNDSENI